MPYSRKRYRVTTPILRLRATPEGTGRILARLTNGAIVNALEGLRITQDNIEWQQVEYAQFVGWVGIMQDGKPLIVPATSSPPPNPDPNEPSPNLFGTNFIGPGAFHEWLAFYERMAKKGKPLAGAVVVNQPDIVRTLKAISPRTIVVYRSTDMPERPQVTGNEAEDYRLGQAFFDKYLNTMGAGAGADYYQFTNEATSYDNVAIWRGNVAAEIGMMHRAAGTVIAGRRMKLAIFGLNVGFPAPGLDDHLRPAFELAQEAGHLYCYHSYTAQGSNNPRDNADGTTMRWVGQVRDFPALDVGIGEFGYYSKNASFIGAAETVYRWRIMMELVKPYRSRLKFICDWASKGATNAWAHSDNTSAIPLLEDWLTNG